MESGRERRAAASTASPRSPARSSTPPTSAPPTCRAGRPTTSHAMLVRAPDATHVYTGMDLARLAGTLKPAVVVTAADFDKTGTRVPEFYAGDLFCPVGKTPLYMGQPVALLIFETFDAFDRGAARAARRHVRAVRRGDRAGRRCRTTAPFASPASPAPTPDAPDVYSPVQEGWVSPGKFQNTRAAGLGRRSPRRPTGAYGKAADLRRADPRRACREGSRICWCSTASSRPSRSIRCSSSRKAASPGSTRQRQPARARARRAVALRGGGVDRASCSARRSRRSSRRASTRSSPMSAAASAGATTRRSSLYVALAAMFFPGKPVRLAHDRYQQFQGGIKRHAFKMQLAHRHRPRDRQDPGLRGRPRARRRRSRQLLGQRRNVSARPPRSASTTCRRSTSPRSRCIRAA